LKAPPAGIEPGSQALELAPRTTKLLEGMLCGWFASLFPLLPPFASWPIPAGTRNNRAGGQHLVKLEACCSTMIWARTKASKGMMGNTPCISWGPSGPSTHHLPLPPSLGILPPPRRSGDRTPLAGRAGDTKQLDWWILHTACFENTPASAGGPAALHPPYPSPSLLGNLSTPPLKSNSVERIRFWGAPPLGEKNSVD